MADEMLARALADCLEALRKSRQSLDERLAAYPSMREELEELLRLVELIPSLPMGAAPDPVFVQRTRRRLVAGGPDGPDSTDMASWDPALA
jgi:hypothetical protein